MRRPLQDKTTSFSLHALARTIHVMYSDTCRKRVKDTPGGRASMFQGSLAALLGPVGADVRFNEGTVLVGRLAVALDVEGYDSIRFDSTSSTFLNLYQEGIKKTRFRGETP